MYDHKAHFIVEIDGFASAAFNKCSELSIDVEEASIREGGVLFPIKEPALASISDITLERGRTNDNDFYNWLVQTANSITGWGGKSDDVKRNLSIVQLDRDGSEIRRYNLFGCHVKKAVIGDWDNDASEYTIEKLTLSVGSIQ